MMLIVYTMLVLSTLIAMSSNSWIIIWMMLEINLMSFIPIIMLNPNHNKNSLFKYFIIQTISSSSFISSITLSWLLECLWNPPLNWLTLTESMTSMSMLLKMGMMPFHLWYIEFMMDMAWMIFFMMTTWQKIIPLVIISYFNMNIILSMSVMTSAVISSIQSLSQLNLRKIFALSSINQTSWMTMNSLMSIHLMIMYMMMYALINFSVMYMFNKYNYSYIHDMFMKNKFSPIMKLFMLSNILSLAGLPPFMGFMMKLMSIKFLIQNELYLISTMLVISSLMMLFIYLRMTYSSMILSYTKNKITLLNLNMKHMKMHYYNMNKFMIMLMTINFNSLIIMLFFI
uniref:NADH-ubiquinone oxidoreductase chain 2 n=1 Tax=Janus megamaculatus TaxID=2876199 RepID=A0A8K1WGI2_9HYME|nr:NADH dehydrogenase subunit 2 [Janus megamaculatus]UGN61602.1 NADH dehydrogenase subunit 2 [Janus megamaculatus]